MRSVYGLLFLIAAVGAFLILSNFKRTQPTISHIAEMTPINTVIPTVTTVPNKEFESPLDRPKDRITKKKFGTFVTPQNSPVQPERFTGYHTGIDFETFPDEKDTPVQVHAICSGPLQLKETASGYGGVAVQACQYQKEPVTVVYGHLKLSSITSAEGTSLKSGDVLGVLGAGYSVETDGERKHLHLDIHKGVEINIAGYVQSPSQLSSWIDPCQFFCE